MYDSNLKRWAQWDLPREKLLISKDRMWYSLYAEQKFDKVCQVGELTVCSISEVLLSTHSRSSCAVELFTKDNITHCKRKLISGLESPVLVRTSSRWLYSASVEHKLTLNCFEPNGLENVTQMKIQGVGVLEGTDACDIITNGFKVPARVHGSSLASGHLTELKFPSFDSLYSGDEDVLLSTDWNSTLEVLRELDQELGTLSIKEYHLEGVFHRLRSHRSFRSRSRNVIIAGSLTSITVVVILLAYCCCYRLRCWRLIRYLRRQPRRRQQRAASRSVESAERDGLEMTSRPTEIRVVLPPVRAPENQSAGGQLLAIVSPGVQEQQ